MSLQFLTTGDNLRDRWRGMSDPIDSVVHAAAEVMGVSTDAIRPAVAAAFARAAEAGLDLQTVGKDLGASAAKITGHEPGTG